MQSVYTCTYSVEFSSLFIIRSTIQWLMQDILIWQRKKGLIACEKARMHKGIAGLLLYQLLILQNFIRGDFNSHFCSSTFADFFKKWTGCSWLCLLHSFDVLWCLGKKRGLCVKKVSISLYYVVCALPLCLPHQHHPHNHQHNNYTNYHSSSNSPSSNGRYISNTYWWLGLFLHGWHWSSNGGWISRWRIDHWNACKLVYMLLNACSYIYIYIYLSHIYIDPHRIPWYLGSHIFSIWWYQPLILTTYIDCLYRLLFRHRTQMHTHQL